MRPRHAGDARDPASPPADLPATTRRAALLVAGLAALSATLAGALSLLLFVQVRRQVLHRLTWDHPDLVWASPLGYGALYVLLLALIAPGLLVRPRGGARLAAALSGAGTVLGVMILFPRISQWSSLLLALGAGVQCWRATARPMPALVRPLARVATLLACSYLAVLAGTLAARAMRGGARGAAAAAGDRPNVILLIWDTARAASLSAYGYAERTTPHVEDLAREGVLFERAYANAPWTLPSHASFFTGRNPGELSADWQTPLDEAHPTIAELLREAGYETIALNGNADYGGVNTGLGRGFETYVQQRRSWRQILYSSSFGQTESLRTILRTMAPWTVRAALTKPNLRVELEMAEREMYYARHVTDDFVAWTRTRVDPRPYFAFLNFIDVHEADQLPAWERHVLAGATTRRARYDRALAHLDAQLGRLVAALRARGELDRTIIVLSADHGEHFGENGVPAGHGVSLYDAVLRVPLVIRYPRALPAGTRVPAPVELRDLGATILALARLEAPFPGVPLTRLVSPPAAVAPDTFVHEVSRRINEAWNVPNKAHALKAIRTDSLKYIRRQDGQEALYAYRADSLERVNLVDSAAFRAPLARLRARLQRAALPWR